MNLLNNFEKAGATTGEQLSLFGEENTLFNAGVQQLLEMDFSGCLETLERYRRLFPWGQDTSRKMAMAEFWLERLGKANLAEIDADDAERRYQLWLEFEETFGHPWPEPSIEQEFQVQFFSRLADSMATSGQGEVVKLPGGTPAGLMYLLAGRPDPAIASLQALIAAEPEHARVYGYLGDAHALRGDLRTARICYREAFVMAPGRVDLRHLHDSELKERLEELKVDEGVNGDPLKWFPVVGQLDGFFECRIFRDLEELKEWLRHYVGFVKTYRKDRDMALIPRLFYHAMVLSDNASMMRYIKKVDLIEVRQRMKEWNPALFARHMRELDKKDSRGKTLF